MGENIKFTPEQLTKTFITYRKEFTQLPFLAMQQILQYVSVRTGIRYKEVVPEMGGSFEMGNYKKDKLKEDGTEITARTFQTFFGNSVDSVDPNAIVDSIWGSNVTKGDALKNVPIVVQVASYIIKQIWENVFFNVFTAKHDPADFSQTSKWFNGFSTIIDMDIDGTNEEKKVNISEKLGNLSLGTDSISQDNAVDIIKDFYFGADPRLRGQQLELFLSDQSYHKYTENYQTLHGSLPYNQTYDKKTLEGASNVTFVPLACVPDDFLLLTPKKNIFCLYNQKTDDENYIAEKSLKNHYDIDIIANAFFGTQFESVNKRVFKVWKKKVTA